MITSKSKSIQDIVLKLPAIASSNANVLITGESGTGKEVLAKFIHSMSPRAKKEMVSINCAAIPESLLESELFGYKKGAFTGATSDYKGLFEVADGGTIFLDEIGDMALRLQGKLLRVLQERKLRSVGSIIEKNVDFKLIAATNRNLKLDVERGQFREDLFYRLNVVPITLPPLRCRKDDIPNLVTKFLNHFSTNYGLSEPLKITNEVMGELVHRNWPGNIRELENLIEQVTVLNRDKKIIELHHLPEEIKGLNHENFELDYENFKTFPTVSELTNKYIDFVLKQVNLHQGEASRILGVSRRTIYRRIKSQVLNGDTQEGLSLK